MHIEFKPHILHLKEEGISIVITQSEVIVYEFNESLKTAKELIKSGKQLVDETLRLRNFLVNIDEYPFVLSADPKLRKIELENLTYIIKNFYS